MSKPGDKLVIPHRSKFVELPKPIPSPLYSCLHCREEYSWPAEDLFWSEIEQGWICHMCWDDRCTWGDDDDDQHEQRGISLAKEMKARGINHA